MSSPDLSTADFSPRISALFVYGSLMCPEVWAAILKRVPPMSSATLKGFKRCRVRDCTYPAVTPANDSFVVHGMSVTSLSRDEIAIMDHFEGDMSNSHSSKAVGGQYQRMPVVVFNERF